MVARFSLGVFAKEILMATLARTINYSAGHPADSLQAKRPRLKFQRSRQMLGKIRPVVPTRVNVKLMRDVPRRQDLVERLGAGIESVPIFRSAIKINLQSRDVSRPRQSQRVVAIPESSIRRRTKHVSQKPHSWISSRLRTR